jgi:hypothetical protein
MDPIWCEYSIHPKLIDKQVSPLTATLMIQPLINDIPPDDISSIP